MSKGSVLRALVAQRLTAAAEDIFSLIERTVLEYEEELCRSKEENERKQQLLDTVLCPQVNRAGVQFRMLGRTEETECIIPDLSKPPQSAATPLEIHEEEINDGPEPEGSEPTASEMHGKVFMETEELPVEPDPPAEPEPLDFCSSPEMDSEASDEDGDPPEVTDVQSPSQESPKPKGRRRRRRSRKTLNSHNNLRHQCSVCEKVLKGPSNNLLRHIATHTGHKPFHCSICKKRFAQKSYFKKHMQAHQTEEPREMETFSCSVCDMRFKRQVILKKHLESHAATNRPEDAVHRKELQARSRREVGVQHEPPVIKEQEEEVEPQAQLGENLLMKPSGRAGAAGSGQFQCDLCHRSFATRTRLKRHAIVHTGAKPFSCPVCHKFFSQKYNVRLHMAVHTDERPYTCRICLKSYRRNDDLRTHVASHTGQVLFSCVICNASFKQRNCLATHMRLHTGVRPYRCSVCDKTFVQKSNLSRHELSHTGQKPFRCPVCPQRFLQRCDIRKHMAIHA